MHHGFERRPAGPDVADSAQLQCHHHVPEAGRNAFGVVDALHEAGGGVSEGEGVRQDGPRHLRQIACQRLEESPEQLDARGERAIAVSQGERIEGRPAVEDGRDDVTSYRCCDACMVAAGVDEEGGQASQPGAQQLQLEEERTPPASPKTTALGFVSAQRSNVSDRHEPGSTP